MQGPTTNYQLEKMARKIPHFRGVFTIDKLPPKIRSHECAIINLEASYKGHGTHWVCYRCENQTVYYFDSFGNLKPPKALQKYFRGKKVFYNHERYQNLNENNCGYLCISFLKGEIPCL